MNELIAVDREHVPVPRCHNPCFSINKDAQKWVFLFVINERIRKVLNERTRRSFRGALFKSLGTKVMHGRISGDFLQPSLIFQIESNLRTIHSMVMEKTLTPTQNQHHVWKNCLGNLCILRMRNRDHLNRECKETEGHETKEKESRN